MHEIISTPSVKMSKLKVYISSCKIIFKMTIKLSLIKNKHLGKFVLNKIICKLRILTSLKSLI